jgi:intergrase/recombinase
MMVPIRPTPYHEGYVEGKQIGRQQGRRDGALALRRALARLRECRKWQRAYRSMATFRGEMLVKVNERQLTALLDAAARYQDAWRVLAAGDATDEEKRAYIRDMHEAREDLFDATEVALRAGGASETETST